MTKEEEATQAREREGGKESEGVREEEKEQAGRERGREEGRERGRNGGSKQEAGGSTSLFHVRHATLIMLAVLLLTQRDWTNLHLPSSTFHWAIINVLCSYLMPRCVLRVSRRQASGVITSIHFSKLV